MRVFSPDVSNRLIARMPDLPVVRFFQFSALPAPSEVTTPMPVTTTTGRRSLLDGMRLSLRRLDQRHSFAPPVADPSDHHALERAGEGLLDPGIVGRREKRTTAQSQRGEGDVHGELRLTPVAEIATGGAYGKRR